MFGWSYLNKIRYRAICRVNDLYCRTVSLNKFEIGPKMCKPVPFHSWLSSKRPGQTISDLMSKIPTPMIYTPAGSLLNFCHVMSVHVFFLIFEEYNSPLSKCWVRPAIRWGAVRGLRYRSRRRRRRSRPACSSGNNKKIYEIASRRFQEDWSAVKSGHPHPQVYSWPQRIYYDSNTNFTVGKYLEINI